MNQPFQRLDHLAIVVRDTDEALKFYRDTPGLPVRRGEPAVLAARLAPLRGGAVADVNAAAPADLDALTHGLAAAEAAGQRWWRLGPDSRWPGLAYIVFPGNVGAVGALVALVGRLSA